jgi:hypothetical protein
VHTGFWWGNLKKGDHLEGPGVEGRIILKWILGSGVRGMDLIDLDYNENIWRAVLNEFSCSIEFGEFLD